MTAERKTVMIFILNATQLVDKLIQLRDRCLVDQLSPEFDV